MFSNIFADSKAENFFPVTSKFQPNEFSGTLEPKDTQWLTMTSGMVTETQVWYTILDDGTFVMCQVIHSATGLWYPSINFTFKTFNPITKERFWRSIPLSNFTSVSAEKRSCKADNFSITYKPSTETGFAEQYTINATLAKDLLVTLTVSRPTNVQGFKVGTGQEGGYSYFGSNQAKPDGYVVHRFWPRTSTKGFINQGGKSIEVNDTQGIFIHAIQGMRPNLVATRWNFLYFQSREHNGISAVQMEFTTCPTHGKTGSGSGGVKVNLGGLVVGGKLAAVTGETHWPGVAAQVGTEVRSRATHLDTQTDKSTGHPVPGRLQFDWAGPSIIPDATGTVSATLETQLSEESLVEKVDVLGEVPGVVKSVVNLTGTKPYIYQWLKPATLKLTAPGKLVQGSDLNNAAVEGWIYTEATFIS